MATSLSISTELTYVRLRRLMGYFLQASKQYNLPLALLLAIASRESRMGLALAADGTGDHGYGYGIMQIDRRHHPEFTTRHHPTDHEANIRYGSRFLATLLDRFGGKRSPAIAAYNAGANRVTNALRAGLSPDAVTTGGNYARDVSQRTTLIADLLELSKATSITVSVVPVALIALATYNYITTSDL